MGGEKLIEHLSKVFGGHEIDFQKTQIAIKQVKTGHYIQNIKKLAS